MPDLICGIANVVEGLDGKKKCGDIAWYGPPSTCDAIVRCAVGRAPLRRCESGLPPSRGKPEEQP